MGIINKYLYSDKKETFQSPTKSKTLITKKISEVKESELSSEFISVNFNLKSSLDHSTTEKLGINF